MHLTRIYGEEPLALGEIFEQAGQPRLKPYGRCLPDHLRPRGRAAPSSRAPATSSDLDHGTYPL